MKYFNLSLALLFGLFASSCTDNDGQKYLSDTSFKLENVQVEDQVSLVELVNVNPEGTINLLFSEAINEMTTSKGISLLDAKDKKVSLDIAYSEDTKTIILLPRKALAVHSSYRLVVQPTIQSKSGNNLFSGKVVKIATGEMISDKFPRITDDELLNLVQENTFKYFWDYAHPTSGMSRERISTPDIVTTGGTGFGVMAMISAVERGFITRQEAAVKVNQIASFLNNKADKFHGAFSHWIDGNTGNTLPFSEFDNGADLVETALLFQGLLSARAYFDSNVAEEVQLRADITNMWEAIDWNFFTRGENILYWHWSPTDEWKMNLPIRGWNESLIVYVLAASSPTHPISADVYHQGWASGPAFINGSENYGIKLPLGPKLGGPLFFSHYSFLGLDPNKLADQYANYFEQNKAQTLVNRAYVIQNPNGYKGYSQNSWGLTAGDGNKGYSAFSPTNDEGVITLTAALSSIIYTPEESLDALRYFYYKMGDKLWSNLGFIDGFNLTANWYATDYIAINQGPIIISIENYRSKLIWNNFMQIDEVQKGLQRLGFTGF